MQYNSVYITARNEEEARNIGRKLVEEKLAACANIHPIISIYRWQNQVVEDKEAALILKTRADLIDQLIRRVKEMHSYKVPCIVAWPIEKGNSDYLAWIEDSTRLID